MTRSVRKTAAVAALALFTSLMPVTALAKDSFSICWSIYVGWMPWDYGAQQKIVDKWADKYDIDIDVVQINDYVESTPPAAGMVRASMLVMAQPS